MKRSLTNRHNAKARQSTSHPRKRQKISHESEDGDPNALVVAPKSEMQKKEERRERMLKQLLDEQENSKASKQKKKRLEKYIDKKLMEEEKRELLTKLEKSQKTVKSTGLVSASLLGSGLQERPERGMDVDDDEEPELEPVKTATKQTQQQIGAGLKSFKGWKTKKPQEQDQEEESDFDSSDSAYDSTSDDEETENEDEDESEPEPEPVKKRSLGFKAWATQQLNQAKGLLDPSDPDSDPAPEPSVPASVPIAPTPKVPPPKKPSPAPVKPPSVFASLALKSSSAVKPAILRKQEIQEARLELPILSHEHEIIETVLLNPVTVIHGHTGSGKTTQVVQFLYEAGFGFPESENPGLIGITQPRRVAAVSTAQRVSEELAPASEESRKVQPKDLVGYQIRYQSTISPQTRIKFMTDGVLLREIQTDFLLEKYSVIVLDEAHERSINTDLLIGLLSRTIKLRETRWKESKGKPLRLIIMSASSMAKSLGASNVPLPETSTDPRDRTLPDESNELEPSASRTVPLFTPSPPLLTIPSRTHPISMHFSKRTRANYVDEVIKKVSKIHTRLPSGAILVFLTGMEEITGVCRELDRRFGAKRKARGRLSQVEEPGVVKSVSAAKVPVEVEDIELGDSVQQQEGSDINEEEDKIEDPEGLDTSDEEDGRDEDEMELDRELGLPSPLSKPRVWEEHNEKEAEEIPPMHVLPLHSLLPSSAQMAIFKGAPEGHRMCIVATNIAETSLTIPGVRYVVDSGRVKERHYNALNGLTTYPINFISKSSALQRAGRAGRTGPGHCYRLYSSAVFQHYFDEDKKAEISNIGLEGLVLTMKGLGLEDLETFPWVENPDISRLRKAEDLLTTLGALAPSSSSSSYVGGVMRRSTNITSIGQTMALFPLAPRHARMLVSAKQKGVLKYVVVLVSALSVGDPFILPDLFGDDKDAEEGSGMKDMAKKEIVQRKRKEMFALLDVHSSLGSYASDAFRLLSVVGAYEYAGGGKDFCEKNFLRTKAMEEIHKFRSQLIRIVQSNFELPENGGEDGVGFDTKLVPPSDLQLKILRQLICASLLDRVAFRADLVSSSMKGTQFATSQGVPYRIASTSVNSAIGVNGELKDVYIHHSSVLADRPPPEYIVFEDLVESKSGKRWIKGVTQIHPSWLASLGKGKGLVTFSKPAKNAKGVMMVVPRWGAEGWELPAVGWESVQ